MKKQGVLIVNLGTPDKPEAKEVRAYLKKFLSDKNVIDMPRWFWLPLLNGVILNVRPKKSAKLYQSIWTEEGSPLLVHTKNQTKKLQAKLPDHVVRYAMSYSTPFIPDVLAEMKEQGVEELTIIPLYPQYSTTTTLSIYEEVTTYYLKQKNMPTFRFVSDFYNHPIYTERMAAQINEVIAEKKIDQIIFSYHGIPKKYADNGDPYPEHCYQTTAEVMKLVKNVPGISTFQSKFGPSEWLTPSTEDVMREAASQGNKNIIVLTPAFVSDCLETLEEIDEDYREVFMENGGESMTYLPPLNDSPECIELLADLVKKN